MGQVVFRIELLKYVEVIGFDWYWLWYIFTAQTTYQNIIATQGVSDRLQKHEHQFGFMSVPHQAVLT